MSSSVNEIHKDTQFHFGSGFTWFDLPAKILTVHLVAFVVSHKHLLLRKKAIFTVETTVALRGQTNCSLRKHQQ